ncbi:MAG: endonuclease YncB(thermonuclease family) [Myxococcota bacterium]
MYDGDTLTLSTGDKVRLRGVNTPELRPSEDYGIEAREAAKLLVLQREVLLGYGSVTRDGYGRLLASVTTTAGEDLAATLLEQGLGHLFIIPPDELDVAMLTTAQNAAKAANRGVWSTDRYKGDLHITSFHANADGDDNNNINGEYLRVCNVSSRPVDLKGYTIADISGRSWELPSLIIPIGHTVKIHSGTGSHQADAADQLAVYLGSTRPIWSNTRDRATIYDRYGQVVDSRHHEPATAPRR